MQKCGAGLADFQACHYRIKIGGMYRIYIKVGNQINILFINPPVNNHFLGRLKTWWLLVPKHLTHEVNLCREY